MIVPSVYSAIRRPLPQRHRSPIYRTTRQCRHLHESYRKINDLAANTPFPDLQLAKTFKERYAYTTEDIRTLNLTFSYPKTIIRYWRVAQTMRRKGLIPFVHGQSQIWSVAQRIYKALGYRNCQLLRYPNQVTRKTTSVEIIDRIHLIEKERKARREANPLRSRLASVISREPPLDHTSELRNHLLAVTIGLFHIERKESPFSFVIGGIYGNAPGIVRIEGNQNILHVEDCKKIANSMIAEAMPTRGYNPKVTHELLQNIKPLYQEAAKLPIGQFVVCGVPYDRLSNAVYHSKRLGNPTGIPIDNIVKDVSSGIRDHDCQARFMLCQETIADESGIDIVNIMDDFETRNYCESSQSDFLPPQQEEGLKDVISCENNKMEDKELAQVTHFYEKVDRVIHASLMNKN